MKPDRKRRPDESLRREMLRKPGREDVHVQRVQVAPKHAPRYPTKK